MIIRLKIVKRELPMVNDKEGAGEQLKAEETVRQDGTGLTAEVPG